MVRIKAFTACLVLILAGTGALAQTYATGLEPNPPQYPVIKIKKGATQGGQVGHPQNPANPSLPEGLGGVTIGGGEIRAVLGICYQYVKSETNDSVVSADKRDEVQESLFESAVNVATVRKRIASRWLPSQLEKDTSRIIDERMATHPEVQRQIIMDHCVDASWEKLGRMNEDQQKYLLEALDYMDYYLK